MTKFQRRAMKILKIPKLVDLGTCRCFQNKQKICLTPVLLPINRRITRALHPRMAFRPSDRRATDQVLPAALLIAVMRIGLFNPAVQVLVSLGFPTQTGQALGGLLFGLLFSSALDCRNLAVSTPLGLSVILGLHLLVVFGIHHLAILDPLEIFDLQFLVVPVLTNHTFPDPFLTYHLPGQARFGLLV